MAERLCFFGITSSLRPYLIGNLGYESVQANSLTSTITTLVFLSPLLGAYIADVKIGCYKTILLFGTFYLCGAILVSISSLPQIDNSILFLIGLYGFVCIGSGGIKPNVITFGTC